VVIFLPPVARPTESGTGLSAKNPQANPVRQGGKDQENETCYTFGDLPAEEQDENAPRRPSGIGNENATGIIR
jgi:hypothetical protein